MLDIQLLIDDLKDDIPDIVRLKQNPIEILSTLNREEVDCLLEYLYSRRFINKSALEVKKKATKINTAIRVLSELYEFDDTPVPPSLDSPLSVPNKKSSSSTPAKKKQKTKDSTSSALSSSLKPQQSTHIIPPVHLLIPPCIDPELLETSKILVSHTVQELYKELITAGFTSLDAIEGICSCIENPIALNFDNVIVNILSAQEQNNENEDRSSPEYDDEDEARYEDLVRLESEKERVVIERNHRNRIHELKTDLTVALLTAGEFQLNKLLDNHNTNLRPFIEALDSWGATALTTTPNKKRKFDDTIVETKSPSPSSSSYKHQQQCRDNLMSASTEDVVNVKSSIVSLLLLEKDCFKFYPTCCTGYILKLCERLGTSKVMLACKQSLCSDTMSNIEFSSNFRRFHAELEREINSLHRALGYTGTAVCTEGIPHEFLDADPSLKRDFSLEDDGFEIL